MIDLKKFRHDYGKDLVSRVCINAYRLTSRGCLPLSAVSISETSCAADLNADELLNYSGYMAEIAGGCVFVYRIRTQTETALLAMSHGEWKYDDRAECVSRLGENCRFEPADCIGIPPGAEACLYNHRGKYSSAVILDGPGIPSEALKRIGHILALNALAYYSDYVSNLPLLIQYSGAGFEHFLMTRNIMFMFRAHEGKMPLIRDWLFFEENKYNAEIKISGIHVYGNFEN